MCWYSVPARWETEVHITQRAWKREARDGINTRRDYSRDVRARVDLHICINSYWLSNMVVIVGYSGLEETDTGPEVLAPALPAKEMTTGKNLEVRCEPRVVFPVTLDRFESKGPDLALADSAYHLGRNLGAPRRVAYTQDAWLELMPCFYGWVYRVRLVGSARRHFSPFWSRSCQIGVILVF